MVEKNLSEILSAPGRQAASLTRTTHLRSLAAPLSAIATVTSLSETNPAVAIGSQGKQKWYLALVLKWLSTHMSLVHTSRTFFGERPVSPDREAIRNRLCFQSQSNSTKTSPTCPAKVKWSEGSGNSCPSRRPQSGWEKTTRGGSSACSVAISFARFSGQLSKPSQVSSKAQAHGRASSPSCAA